MPFPKPHIDSVKCKKWITACKRDNFGKKNINKYTYMCSEHFIGYNSPTAGSGFSNINKGNSTFIYIRFMIVEIYYWADVFSQVQKEHSWNELNRHEKFNDDEMVNKFKLYIDVIAPPITVHDTTYYDNAFVKETDIYYTIHQVSPMLTKLIRYLKNLPILIIGNHGEK